MRSLKPYRTKLQSMTAALLIALSAQGAASTNAGPKLPPLVLAKDSYVYVGGEYTPINNDSYVTGQMYARYMEPLARRSPYPIVLIAGGGHSGAAYTGTPDGREGWAQHFVRAGYAVYVVDRPGAGKSPWSTDRYGNIGRSTPVSTATFFYSIPEQFPDSWPQARFHTQWPGEGVPGDPIFDRYMATLVPGGSEEELVHGALALLDEIGPAIVLTHSITGRVGWVLADRRPDLVKAHLAVEPNGPPFHDAPPPWARSPGEALARPWGVTALPVTYDPPVTDPSQIAIVQEAQPQGPDLVRCWNQDPSVPGHPRQLVNLRDLPVLIINGEASYHAGYSHCTVQFLEDAGLTRLDWIPLASVGIHGHGHIMMVEKDNDKIADLMVRWLRQNVR